MNITAIIVIKGLPAHVHESISSIENIVTEIIIGDIEMDTELKNKLKQNPKVKIVPIDSSVPYADLVKEDLKTQATGDYILYMDPDEVFPQKVLNIITSKISDNDFFFLPRKNIMFGKWIAHSRWWPDYQLRFFKKNTVIWPKTIHPIPKTTGTGYKLSADEEMAILHYNYENIDEYMSKMPRYAKGDATERLTNKESYTLKTAIEKGISEFISRFFASEGYKDGMHGLALAFLQMFYYLLVYFYYWELQKYPEVPVKEMLQNTETFFHQGNYETAYWEEKTKLNPSVKNKLKIKLIKRL